MVNEQFEAAIATIEKVKKEVNSLKTRLGKLTGRVDQFELMTFQDQLNRLHEQITQHQNSLLETQRFLANFYIIYVHNYSETLLSKHRPDMYNNCVGQFVSESSAAATKASISNAPLTIAKEFKSKRFHDLEKLGITTIKITNL